MAGKPTAFLEKILEGKIAKIFREQTLDEQAYLLDENGGTVKVTLEKEKVTVMKFVRFMVGEGIEKRVDNFAQEVMAQVK
jgi:elongation factor Ts